MTYWHLISQQVSLVPCLSPSDHSTTVDLLRPLVHTLPHSLSSSHLLLYTAFQAALQWKESKCEVDTVASNCSLHVEHEFLSYAHSQTDTGLLSLAVDYTIQLRSLHLAIGMCNFLWHMLMEKEVVSLSEKMKKVCLSCDHGRL